MTTKNADEPEKVDLESLDVAEEKRRELRRLFPEVRTEADSSRPSSASVTGWRSTPNGCTATRERFSGETTS